MIHEKFIVDGGEDALISHMVTTQGTDLTLRKQLLLDHGKGILVLPGGVGTLDELWDAVCGKSLGMKGMASKPICVVNSDGYFDGSIMQLQRAAKEGMCYFTDLDDYFHVEETAEGALNWVEKKIKCTQPLVDDDINCSGETEVVVPVLDRFKIREV